MKMKTCFVLFTVTFFCLSPFARAATRTWDGGGANDNWATAGNWVGDVAPNAGDDLVFPSGAARLSNSNNFVAGTTFNSITISGTNYFLYGSNIVLNAGLNATNTTFLNYFFIPLTLNSNQTITTGNMGVNLYLYGAIDTNGKDLTFAGNGMAQVSAFISGAGGLIKVGTGGLLLYTSNTFAGPVQVVAGTLNIYQANTLGATNGSTMISAGTILTLGASLAGAVPEPLAIAGTLAASGPSKTLTGPITLSASNAAIVGPFTINGVISGSGGFTKSSSDALTLNASNTYTGTTKIDGPLVVNGNQPASPILLSGTLSGTGTVGTITASGSLGKHIYPGSGGPGILSCSNVILNSSTFFSVKLNGAAPGSGYDQLKVNGSVALGDTTLSVTLGYTPAVGDSFTIINNDGSEPVTNTFNGLLPGNYFSVGGRTFRINYAGGDGNDVVLLRTNAPPATFTSVASLMNGVTSLQNLGLPGLTYSIEAALNLNPVIAWTPIGSAVANGSGVFSFTDTNAPSFPMRFYRTVSP